MAKDQNVNVKSQSRLKTPTKKQKKAPYRSPDGRTRDLDIEKKLNEAFSIVFSGAAGLLVKNYLRSISTNRVLPPGTPSETITYYEGSRWMMGIIETRIRDGQEKKP